MSLYYRLLFSHFVSHHKSTSSVFALVGDEEGGEEGAIPLTLELLAPTL